MTLDGAKAGEIAVGAERGSAAVSSTEEVYARLHDMLLDGAIPAGQVISQVKLARQMGVSTTPLREALRLLQADGLLVAEHNRRPRVAPVEPRDIDTAYASRIVVEALAIRLTVPKLTGDGIAALRSELDAMAEAGRERDLPAWEPIHRGFHRRLTEGADESLQRIIEPLTSHCERYRRLSLFNSPAPLWELGDDEHERIVEACEQRDPDLASDLLARHFARSALTVLAKVDPGLEPVAVRAALRMVGGGIDSDG